MTKTLNLLWLLSIAMLIGGLFVARVTYKECEQVGYSRVWPLAKGYNGYISCEVIK